MAACRREEEEAVGLWIEVVVVVVDMLKRGIKGVEVARPLYNWRLVAVSQGSDPDCGRLELAAGMLGGDNDLSDWVIGC